MIYYGDTIKCDDASCGICLRDEFGRDFGHNRCQQCGLVDCDLMMIRTELWRQIAEDPQLLLCADCMDGRLVRARGFGIVPEDLTDCPINHLLWPELMARTRSGCCGVGGRFSELDMGLQGNCTPIPSSFRFNLCRL